MLLVGDVVLVLLFAVIAPNRSRDLVLLSAVCFPTLLISNILFLQRRLKLGGPHREEGGTMPGKRKLNAYICSGVFFVGTLYGVLMIFQGELPWKIAPVLLVPLSLAIYCLKFARSGAGPKP